MMPHDLPPWQTVYYHFNKWRKEGTEEEINTLLREELRQAEGREATPSAGIIDSQSAKTTHTKGERGYDAGKKVKGRKRHLLVDTIGLILLVVVTPADVQNRDGAKLVFHWRSYDLKHRHLGRIVYDQYHVFAVFCRQ